MRFIKPTIRPFLDSLKEVLYQAKKQDAIALNDIFAILAGRGYAAMLILLSFPFCFPIQIPGFSTPFGFLLAFLGLRITFGKHMWWPEWILQKTVSSKKVISVTGALIRFFEHPRMHILRPRWLIFSHSLFRRIDGIIVFLLGAFLALPLPIPFTNIFSAFPILAIGLGLLEDDGLFLVIGYILALLALFAIAMVFSYGASYLSNLFS